jgi:hypothetical protein
VVLVRVVGVRVHGSVAVHEYYHQRFSGGLA